MAYPAAPTESGGDKLHFLTTDGNVAGGWFGVDTGVTGTGANTVAFAAIATHVHDDAAGSPGGLATSSVPLVLVGGVRDDALGGLTPVAGDAVYLLVDANGALWTHDNALDAALDGSELQVDIVTMPAVDTELPAAAALADGAANPTTPIVGAALLGWNTVTWDRLVSSIANGLEVDVTRVQGTVAVSNAGLTELAAAINASRMDVNIAASIALDVSAATVTVDSELPAAAALSDAFANPTAPGVGAFLMGFDGVDWERVRVTNTGQLHVEIQGSLPAGTNNIGDVDVLTLPGTAAEAAALPGVFVVVAGDDGIDTQPFQLAADGDLKITLDSEAVVLGAGSASIGVLGANSGVDIGDVDVTSITGVTFSNAAMQITGDEAHDAADAGNPLKFGGRAQDSEAQPDEVADNDRVDALFDRSGYLRVRGDFDPSFADINDALSGDNTIIAAQAAGKRIAVWSIMIVADGTVDVRWEDGAAGTPFTGQVPLQEREGYTWSAGGLVPLFVGSAATLLNLELSAAVNVHGSVSYTVIDD